MTPPGLNTPLNRPDTFKILSGLLQESNPVQRETYHTSASSNSVYRILVLMAILNMTTLSVATSCNSPRQPIYNIPEVSQATKMEELWEELSQTAWIDLTNINSFIKATAIQRHYFLMYNPQFVQQYVDQLLVLIDKEEDQEKSKELSTILIQTLLISSNGKIQESSHVSSEAINQELVDIPSLTCPTPYLVLPKIRAAFQERFRFEVLLDQKPISVPPEYCEQNVLIFKGNTGIVSFILTDTSTGKQYIYDVQINTALHTVYTENVKYPGFFTKPIEYLAHGELIEYGVTTTNIETVTNMVHDIDPIVNSPISKVILFYSDYAAYDKNMIWIGIPYLRYDYINQDNLLLRAYIWHELLHKIFDSNSRELMPYYKLDIETLDYWGIKGKYTSGDPQNIDLSIENPFLTEWNKIYQEFNELYQSQSNNSDNIYTFFTGAGGHPDNATELFAASGTILRYGQLQTVKERYYSLSAENQQIVKRIFQLTIKSFNPYVTYWRINKEAGNLQDREDENEIFDEYYFFSRETIEWVKGL